MNTKSGQVGSGRIVWLGSNRNRYGFSHPRKLLTIKPDGIVGDSYRGRMRPLGVHDSRYRKTSGLKRGDMVVNHRPITALEEGERDLAEAAIGQPVGSGMLRENIIFSLQFFYHSLSFSRLPPMSRLVIGQDQDVILWINEENNPCAGVARPFSEHYDDRKLMPAFIKAFQGRRGQMISVMSPGLIRIGDPVKVFRPLK